MASESERWRREALTAVSLGGFKSHVAERRIELRPLTVLAGANSAGKSSVMQAVLLLKQTLGALAYDTGGLKLDGPNVTFTDSAQFFSRVDETSPAPFRVELEFFGRGAVRVVFEPREMGVEVVATSYRVNDELSELLAGVAIPNLENRRAFHGMNLKTGGLPQRLGCFLVPPPAQSGVLDFPLLAIRAHVALSILIHVPAYRGSPSRTYPRLAVSHDAPGVFSAVFASLLAHWQEANATRLAQVNDALRKLGLAGSVSTRQVDASNLSLRVPRTLNDSDDKHSFDIADVGFGVAQALPVVVALIAAEPAQTVFIEEPEMHLHPRAQQVIADLIADAARRGVRCIIETHSDTILTRLQWDIARAENRLAPSDAIFHWFSRDAKTGESVVKSVQPDESGAYGDWPVDFGDVAADNSTAYIEAAYERLTPEEPKE